MITLLSLILLQPPAAPAQPAPAVDWKSAEAPFLTDHVQLTLPERFLKAGEAYFDHQSPPQWIIFQAIERPSKDKSPETNYAMYVARLNYKGNALIGLEEPILLSPPGSANTCGWIHPVHSEVVTFGSTLVKPAENDTPGYSRDRQRYQWQFPREMEVVSTRVNHIAFFLPRQEGTGVMRCLVGTGNPAIAEAITRGLQANSAPSIPASASGSSILVDTQKMTREEIREIVAEMLADAETRASLTMNGEPAKPLFSRPGYDAEGSFSPDGRFFLYTHVDTTTNDPNLWIFDTKTTKHYPIVTAKGYDGGPFFSPDGKWICYRSDRKGSNVLQLFIGELAFGDDGDASVPIGLSREIQLTAELPGVDDSNQHVSWCPYWSRDGKYLIYASSAAAGHGNYEVLAIEVAPIMQPGATIKPSELRRARITNAPGFDGLPVFSDDGKYMMWTSQRGPKIEGEQRPSSQLWIATVHGEPAWGFVPPPPPPAAAPPAAAPASSPSK